MSQPSPRDRADPADAVPSAEALLLQLCQTVIISLSDPPEANVKAPVVTLQSERNLYHVLEAYVQPDVLGSPDKLWRAIKIGRGVQSWRPRVNGVQLKALQVRPVAVSSNGCTPSLRALTRALCLPCEGRPTA